MGARHEGLRVLVLGERAVRLLQEVGDLPHGVVVRQVLAAGGTEDLSDAHVLVAAPPLEADERRLLDEVLRRAPWIPLPPCGGADLTHRARDAGDGAAGGLFVVGRMDPFLLPALLRCLAERGEGSGAADTTPQVLEETLAALELPIVALDRSLRVQLCNEAYARAVGKAREELEGRVLTELFPQFSRSRSYSAYLHVLATGQPQDVEGPCGDRFLRARVFPAPFGLVAMAEDMTSYRRAQEELRERAAQLQAKNEELEAFAHTVAHGLRTPLSAVRGFVEGVLEHWESMDPEQVRLTLDYVREAATRMDGIIGELLLLAEVSRGRTVQTSPLDMTSVVQDALKRLGHRLAQLEGQVTIESPLPRAEGYGPWVEEVWANYLGNALEHGGRPPFIRVFGREEGSWVRFCVEDNGPGIPPQDQALLFRPFSRLPTSRSRGFGLGLSIVQRIVKRLGGEVGVWSTPGKGSTFWFTLPAGRRAGEGAPERAGHDGERDGVEPAGLRSREDEELTRRE